MLKATSSIVNVSQITGVLPVANGGTSVTTSTGTGSTVLSAAPTLSGNVTLSTGNLVVADTKGIDFSATPGTGTSELLADYEEGTWTPSFVSLTVVGNLTTTGVYTKIGRAVFWSMRIQATTSTSSTVGVTLMQGFPFVIADGDNTVASTINFGALTDLPNGTVSKSGGSTTEYLPTWSAVADVVLSGFYTV